MKADEAAGKPLQTLNDFFEDFFLRRYGLKKMAQAKLAEMVFSVQKTKGKFRRIEVFAILCGMERQAVYSPATAEFFIYMLRCMYSTGHSAIKERLDDGYGKSRVTLREALNGIIGVGANPSQEIFSIGGAARAETERARHTAAHWRRRPTRSRRGAAEPSLHPPRR